MLLPRYSLRTILKLLTASTVLFIVVRHAFLGSAWAVGIVIGFLSILCCLVTYAVLYGITLLMSRVIGSQALPARTSRGGLQVSPDEHMRPDRKTTVSTDPAADT